MCQMKMLPLSGFKAETPCSSAPQEYNFPPACDDFLLHLLFNPEDGGDVFLRNVGRFPKYNGIKPPPSTALFFNVF
jgi:hypothetical protein